MGFDLTLGIIGGMLDALKDKNGTREMMIEQGVDPDMIDRQDPDMIEALQKEFDELSEYNSFFYKQNLN